ncbi:hypothetical protein N7466_009951 [Penicillium verhagenii]|uniref:uncharacterized protein n=1 Tax=Penicillium verhagenii TaxID=1562060 RepID=UPI0025454772|nr:uncharacterized protein N7466_009951 [Penicillium verhagenii]KAJ5919008.1 hypothetical protein N7466_009951 [Penicillium verhagenii]
MVSSSDDVAASQPTAPKLTGTSEHTINETALPERSFYADLLKECLDLALDFLSTSSNERLLGVFALLVVATYLIFGRLGLLLIGIALGAVLHASWEGPLNSSGNDIQLPIAKKRRELALEVSKRLLDWPLRTSDPTSDEAINGNLVSPPEDLSVLDLNYETFRPATAAALRVLTDAIVKDYVKYWYDPILPEESTFPGSCRRTLTHFVTTISSHLSRKRTEDTFLQFLTNSSSIIIVFLNELAAAFTANGSSPVEAQRIVDQYLENFPDSSLANVLSKEQQRKKLDMIADDILSNYLDPRAYQCSPVRDFLRKIFARVVLESTVISLSRPEFINDWIIYLLQDGESEIMHAIDAGVEGARNQSVNSPRASEDSKNVLSEPPKDKPLSQSTGSSPDQVDIATEDAMREAKRLSAMIASQDLRGIAAQLPARNDHETDIPLSSVTEGSPLTQSVTNDCEMSDQAGTTPPGIQVSSMMPPREGAPPTPPVSLHGAQVMVDDDAAGRENGIIKSKPAWDYLLQVEPTSARSTGWMVFRKYHDFQSLHEMLETVSRLNRIQGFSEQFPALPAWKGKTRHDLSRDLERYLQEAMKYESLAETDRMRRFLEKESSSNEVSVAKTGYSFPSQTAFENMGKGVLGALTNAPKGVAGGGKAVFDGMTGVFGVTSHGRKSTSTSIRQPPPLALNISTETDRGSLDLTDDPIVSIASEVGETFSSMVSPNPPSEFLVEGRPDDVNHGVNQTDGKRDTWASESTMAPPEDLKSSESTSHYEGGQNKEAPGSVSSPLPNETSTSNDLELISQGVRRQQMPITADETQIAVELIFAVINELYTLSSAWNIRRTLLNAAKSYILRPGNPTLETIRTLLQDSMIESHTSDDAIGEYLKKLRENALPTDDEFKAWPTPPTEEEKDKLRDKARKLFVQRGIPQALTSVMGAAASREALEKIFDSLQVESVAQGFVFSVLLQGLRVLTL